jgi:glycogen(starch) synthase
MESSQLYFLLSRFEPSAHVVVEAQLHGLPVICSNRGGSGEAIVEGVTGFTCDPEDLADVVAKTVGLLEDPARLASFSAEARAHAAGYLRWADVADRVQAILTA